MFYTVMNLFINVVRKEQKGEGTFENFWCMSKTC